MTRVGIMGAAAMIGAALSMSETGGARVLKREDPPLDLWPERERVRSPGNGRRSNDPRPGLKAAKRKAKRKAARASRRANLRRS